MAEVEDPGYQAWIEEQMQREYEEYQRRLVRVKPVVEVAEDGDLSPQFAWSDPMRVRVKDGKIWIEFDYEDAAKDLLDHGMAFEYIYDTWQCLHTGDGSIGKCLLATVPQAFIVKSNGVHVSVIGEGGWGKSHSVDMMLELMPEERAFDKSVTPQTLLYKPDGLKEGSIISIDDMVWTTDVGVTVKRITSRFQKEHSRSTVLNGESKTLKAPARLTFWCSQVAMQADEQLRDRFILVETNESSDHRGTVIEDMKKRLACKAPTIADMSESVRICQEIVRAIMNSRPFDVVIPYAERIDIVADPRALNMFGDIIRAFAVFRYPIREVDEKGRLVATVEDFEDAAELYRAMGGIDRDKFSQKEAKVIQAIINRGGSATYKEIASDTGISYQIVREILWGKKTGDHGLGVKCKGSLDMDRSRQPYKVVIVGGINFGSNYVRLAS